MRRAPTPSPAAMLRPLSPSLPPSLPLSLARSLARCSLSRPARSPARGPKPCPKPRPKPSRYAQENANYAHFLRALAEYKKEIGFTGALLLEPKPREPMAHQYNFDAETTLGFLG